MRTRSSTLASEGEGTGTEPPPSPTSTRPDSGTIRPSSDPLIEPLMRLTEAVTIAPRNGVMDVRSQSTVKGPDVRPPDRFSGENSTLLKPFLAQCRMTFLANPSRFTDEHSRV